MFNRAAFTQFDYFLFVTAVSLAFLGILGIYSAGGEQGSGIFARQIVWIALGVAICLTLTSVDYRFLADHAFLFYFCSVALLIGILFFGTEINGSRSWITFAGVVFQPSEMSKLVVVLALAQYSGEINEDGLRGKHLLALAGITLIPVTLVVLQGDLGTAVTYFPILATVVVLMAGLQPRLLLAGLVVCLFLAPVGWSSLEDYQKQRILVTIDPERDPQGIGYQTRQSRIAIGSGGVTGKGLGNGLQSQLGFVPEVHTDFIFALLAEETGLIGAILILLLYFLVLMRLVQMAEVAQDRLGTLIVASIASLMFFHIAVNVGMTLGVLPAIGIPLPLMSYGGSSTLTTFAALGLALSVYRHRFVYR